MQKICVFTLKTLLFMSVFFAAGCGKKDKVLAIGLPYQGGIIAYIDETGKHGLIAAKEDENGEYDWYEAMGICENKNAGGFTDWFLPNKVQLNELYKNRELIKNFAVDYYWSSLEYDINRAWYQYFFNSVTQEYGSKSNTCKVRAVRYF